MNPGKLSRRSAVVIALAGIAAVAATAWLLSRGSDGAGAHLASSRTEKAATAAPPCGPIVGSEPAVEARASRAQPGTVVCLRDGRYGQLHLRRSGRGPDVMVRAQHPGKALISGAVLAGSHLALGHFRIRGQVTVEPGSRKVSILNNRISGGYFGVEAGPTTTTYISDTTIAGNRFVGPFGEDAIRLNRYHDSADRDPFGALVEGNEITNVRENGNHSDCLQSVWGGDGLYFRRNYVHDNRCQGFFVNDQPAPVRNIVLADNLMLRNAAPCAPAASGCGLPSIVQIFGPTRHISIARNTVWTAGDDSPVALRGGPFGRVVLRANVLYRAWSDWTGPWRNFSERKDVVCRWEGTLPRLGRSARRNCAPPFAAPGADDYRIPGGAGVDWSPRNRHFGP